MATVRCPVCREEISPIPLEREEGATRYLCPTCRQPLTGDVVDEFLAIEEEEASG